ncbi:MAG: penicillin-binding protein 2, partial [Parvibaculales bacterium]
MAQHSYKNDIQKKMTRRAVLLGSVQSILAASLIWRMGYLQISERQKYALLADENRINIRPLAPLRGQIFDREEGLLAENLERFGISFIAEKGSQFEPILQRISKIINISPDKQKRLLAQMAKNKKNHKILLAENISWEEFAAINAYSPYLPGVVPEIEKKRFYPMGEESAHIIGYMGRVDEHNTERDPLLRLPQFRVGRAGMERKMDVPLRGISGTQFIEVNAYGHVVRELDRKESRNGKDIGLYIDSKLQKKCFEILKEREGVIVVMDVNNGEVLASASSPSFNPNIFSSLLSSEKWKQIQSSKKSLLVNKAIAGQFSPGSTIKMLICLAALEKGIVPPSHSVECTGRYELAGNVYHCWEKDGHGVLNMRQAVQHSCDVYFYQLAQLVGIDAIQEISQRFGLGKPTGIELIGEKGGIVPGRDWKRANIGTGWTHGDSLLTAIGQGYMLTTPLQLALMQARLVNGGKEITPHLIRSVDGEGVTIEPAKDMGFSQRNLNFLKRAMSDVVNTPEGTAGGAAIDIEGQQMAGKTGTVQVKRISEEERALLEDDERKAQLSRPRELRDHALFTGYAPAYNPRFSICVVLEHEGTGGHIAAPV